MSTHFNCQKHFYFKLFKQLYITIQFSVSTVSMSKIVQFKTIHSSKSTQFECKYRLIVKKHFFRAIQFSQAILLQLIQFSKRTDLVYTQLHVRTVLFEIIQFSTSTHFKCKHGSIVKKHFYFKIFSLA